MTKLALASSVALVAVFASAAHAQPPADDSVAVGDASGFDMHGRYHEHWLPFTGSGMRLDSEDFYRRVGRPDLAAAHARRRWVAIGALATGLAITGAALWYGVSTASQNTQMNCNVNWTFSQFNACVNANIAADQAQSSAMQSAMPWVIAGSLLGAAALGVSAYYFSRPEPVDEAQAEQLAVDHNAGLRAVHVAPYASPSGGGLSLGGNF